MADTPHDPAFAICDSIPLPAFPWRGGFWQGHTAQAVLLWLSGARKDLLAWVITRFSVAPANAHELCVLPELAEFTSGIVVRQRNYYSPKTTEELAKSLGVELLAPYSSKKGDPAPRRSTLLSRFRHQIDTVFSHPTERYSIKREWTRDLWHLTGRLVRKVPARGQRGERTEGLASPPMW